MKEISIRDFDNICIGQVEDPERATGCTVLICKDGMCAGLDVRGGGPASRETELLKPLAAAQFIHAIVLSGGSAFGLDAAGGVMEYLRAHDIGLNVGRTKVPLVVQSDIFDLGVADPMAYPDHAMGYKAAEAAFSGDGGNYRDGNYGGGCGATVGKMKGPHFCMKTGIGSYAVQIGDLKVGALVVVNALGDIYDWKNGQKVAGVLADDWKSFADCSEIMLSRIAPVENKFVENTTIGIIITNGKFNKSQLCKIASMTHDGYARSIRPVHTSADGDSIYAVSVGDLPVDQDVTGVLAAQVMSEAILRAVESAESAYGIPSVKEINIE